MDFRNFNLYKDAKFYNNKKKINECIYLKILPFFKKLSTNFY